MKKCVLLFSGQGSQYSGMGTDFLLDYSNEVYNVFLSVYGEEYRDILNFPNEILDLTINTQPALLLTELLQLDYICKKGLNFQAVSGFSLGEYTALVASGILDYESAFKLIKTRSHAMQNSVKKDEGMMGVVIGQTYEFVKELCDIIRNVWISNINCPGNITIAGSKQSVQLFKDECKSKNIRFIPIAVSVPSHCILMNPAKQMLSKEINDYMFNTPRIDIYMNFNGDKQRDIKIIKENILNQLISPVQFQKTINNLYNDDYRIFIEVGCGKTLCNFIKKTLYDKSDIKVYNVNDIESINNILKEIGEN